MNDTERQARNMAEIARNVWPDADIATKIEDEVGSRRACSICKGVPQGNLTPRDKRCTECFGEGYVVKHCFVSTWPVVGGLGGRLFNLLETDANGEPTQQAKASALDVLDWLGDADDMKELQAKRFMVIEDYGFPTECSPQRIYRAACETLGLKA